MSATKKINPNTILKAHWLIYGLLAISFAALGLYGLRQNNYQMGVLKDQVIAADKAGEGIEQSLTQLSSYVFKHMNTSTTVTLASEYSRDAQAVLEATQPDDVGSEIYEQARRECENPNIPLTARASCLAEYVIANGADVGLTEPDYPPESAYTYSFVAPTWSADIAGLSLLSSAIFFGLSIYNWNKT